MKPKHWFALTLLLTLVGCAAGTSGDGSQRPARTNRYIITAEEVQAATRHNSVFDLVQALRPNWLRGRSAGTVTNPNAGSVVVYMDDVRMGGTEFLRQIQTEAVVSLRYLDANDATTRYGTGHTGGVIQVITRRSGG